MTQMFWKALLFIKVSRREGRIYFEISEILKDVLICKSAKSCVHSLEVTIWTAPVDFSDLFSWKQSQLCIFLTFMDYLLAFFLFLLYEDSKRATWQGWGGGRRELWVQSFACHGFEKITQFLQKESGRKWINTWRRPKSFSQHQKTMSWKWSLCVTKLPNIKYFSGIQILLCNVS